MAEFVPSPRYPSPDYAGFGNVLGNLYTTYQDSQRKTQDIDQNKLKLDQQRAFAGGLPTDANGNTDWVQALRMLVQKGDLGAISSLANLEQSRQSNATFNAELPGLIGGNGGAQVPGGGASPTPNTSGKVAGTDIDRSEVAKYTVERAKALGIDPSIALQVTASEGLSKWSGDQDTSFGPFQLHYGNNKPGVSNPGLGDRFTAQTGLNARDPTTWKQQVDFALSTATKEGWGAWHGWKGDARAGLPNGSKGGAQVASANPGFVPQTGNNTAPSVPPVGAAAGSTIPRADRGQVPPQGVPQTSAPQGSIAALVSGIVSDPQKASVVAGNVARSIGISPDASLTPEEVQRAQRYVASYAARTGQQPAPAQGGGSAVAQTAPRPNVPQAIPGAANGNPTPNGGATAGTSDAAVQAVAAGDPGAAEIAANVTASPGMSDRIAKLLKLSTLPGLSEGQQKVVSLLMQRELDSSKLPNDAKDYLFAKTPQGGSFQGTFTEFRSKAQGGGKPFVMGEDQYGRKIYGTLVNSKPTPLPQSGTATANGADAMDLHGEDYIKTLSPQMQSQVQAIIEGRAPYPTGMLLKSAYGQQLATAVTQADPSFETGNATARVKVRNEFLAGGPNSPASVITAGNTAIQHLGHLSDVVDKLNNSNYPLLNRATNAVSGMTGGGIPLTTFNNIVGRFAEEATKFYRGTGGTESDVQRDLANLNPNMSPAQLHAAIQTQAALMQSKINALQDRWHQGMGPLVSDFPIVQSESREALDRIGQRAGTPSHGAGTQAQPAQQPQRGPAPFAVPDQGGSQAAAQPAQSAAPSSKSPVRVTSPEEAASLPSGATFITPDGQTRVRH
jgi:hypothetical protein